MRVRKGYEQVADQLRELIVDGRAPAGRRLPNESRSRGSSASAGRRSGRRSAARRPEPHPHGEGAGGGSFVTLPTVDHISSRCSSNVGLLAEARTSRSRSCSRHASCSRCRRRGSPPRRRREADIERLRATDPARPAARSTRRGVRLQPRVPLVAHRGCGNTLLQSPRSRSSRRCRRTSRARRSRASSTARSTPTTAGSSRRSRRATRTRAASEMHDHLAFLGPTTRRPGRRPARPLASARVTVPAARRRPHPRRRAVRRRAVGHAAARRPRRRGHQDRGSGLGGRRRALRAAVPGGRGLALLRDVQPRQEERLARPPPSRCARRCSTTSCASATASTRTCAATSRRSSASPTTQLQRRQPADRVLLALGLRDDRARGRPRAATTT